MNIDTDNKRELIDNQLAIDTAIEAVEECVCQKVKPMSELIDKQLMIQDVKSWVGVNSYEQHLIRNVLEWLEEFPTVEPCDDAISRRDAIEAVTDYIFFDVYGGMKPVEKCETEAKSILCEIPTVVFGECIVHENAEVDGYYVPNAEVVT